MVLRHQVIIAREIAFQPSQPVNQNQPDSGWYLLKKNQKTLMMAVPSNHQRYYQCCLMMNHLNQMILNQCRHQMSRYLLNYPGWKGRH